MCLRYDTTVFDTTFKEHHEYIKKQLIHNRKINITFLVYRYISVLYFVIYLRGLVVGKSSSTNLGTCDVVNAMSLICSISFEHTLFTIYKYNRARIIATERSDIRVSR